MVVSLSFWFKVFGDTGLLILCWWFLWWGEPAVETGIWRVCRYREETLICLNIQTLLQARESSMPGELEGGDIETLWISWLFLAADSGCPPLGPLRNRWFHGEAFPVLSELALLAFWFVNSEVLPNYARPGNIPRFWWLLVPWGFFFFFLPFPSSFWFKIVVWENHLFIFRRQKVLTKKGQGTLLCIN